MRLPTLRLLTPLRACGLATALLIAPAGAGAATFTDDFSAPADYSLGGASGIWDGMHNIPLIAGTGQFQAIDGVLRIDTNGVSTGWEGGRSTSPLLFHTVPAGQDFTATVKIAAQTTGFWSAAGIIARAENVIPPGEAPDNAAQNFTTMTSFRTNAANANEGITLMKRIQNGAQITDNGASINTSTPVNQAPLPILVRMDRVAGGMTYNGWVSTDNGASWQFQSRTRPDAGNPLRDGTVPMEVGLSYMTFSTLAGTADLDDFVLDTHAPLAAPGAAVLPSSINVIAQRGDVIVVNNILDTSGANAQPMSWQLIADAMNPPTPTNPPTIRATPALLPGAQGGQPAGPDALGVALPAFADDGSTLFRWNTNVLQAPSPNVLPAQQWALGTYKWTIRSTNDWLQVSNDLTLTVTLVPEPSTIALGGLGLVGLAQAIRRRRR